MIMTKRLDNSIIKTGGSFEAHWEEGGNLSEGGL